MRKAATKFAKLANEFHGKKGLLGIPFAEACNCGGFVHRFGERPDNKRCPDRATKKQKEKLAAVGKLVNGVRHAN